MPTSTTSNGQDKNLPTPNKDTSAQPQNSSRGADLALYLSKAAEAEMRNIRRAIISCGGRLYDANLSYAELRHAMNDRGHTILGLGFSVPDTPDTFRDLLKALTPEAPDRRNVRKALYQLWLCCKHRSMTVAERNDMIDLYTSRLSDYPEVVVVAALTDLSVHAEFWPSWAEMNAAIRKISSHRAALVALCQAKLSAAKD